MKASRLRLLPRGWRVPGPWDAGLTLPARQTDHRGMNTPKPQTPPQVDGRLAKMLELKAQMEEMLAQLEYLRLMMRMGRPLK